MTPPNPHTLAWPRTIWSEAGQINRLNGRPPLGDERAVPPDYFRYLREAGEDHEAALFVAQALPRYDAVAWAARVAGWAFDADVAAGARLDVVRAWLDDPVEAKRRRAGAEAREVSPPDAVSLCAWAVFHSGGSIAPLDHPPASPPRGAAGRFAGAAVIATAAHVSYPADMLRRALDEGALLAARLEIDR